MIPIRKDWQEPYFDGHYVPLVVVLVIAVPFLCMLYFSDTKLAEVTAERNALQAELDGYKSEVARIDARIDVLRKNMQDREYEQHQVFTDMAQTPPGWPDELITNQPSVFVSKRRRKQYVNYLATRSSEGQTRYPCSIGTYAGPRIYGTFPSTATIRRNRTDADRVSQ